MEKIRSALGLESVQKSITVAKDIKPAAETILREAEIKATDQPSSSEDEPKNLAVLTGGMTTLLNVALSEADIAAEKDRQTIANLNKLLYVGSFLIVSAAALFVNFAMTANVKLVALAIVMSAFYGSGLVIYKKSIKLRPAAIAFAGTGMAILPFFGFALISIGGWSEQTAWLVTSILGLVAYGFAAISLSSQLISYITMAFVVSLALSTVSTMGLGMVWYFVVLIFVSTLINSIIYLFPNRLPAIFSKPLKDTGQIIAPITIVASFFVIGTMDFFSYEMLFGLITLHYAVIWLQVRQPAYELLTRALAHLTLIVYAFDVSRTPIFYPDYLIQTMDFEFDFIIIVILSILAMTFQLLYSCLRVRRDDKASVRRESIVAAVIFGLFIVSIPFWYPRGVYLDNPALGLSWQLALMGLIYGLVAVRFRQVGWVYVTLAASVLTPWLLGREVLVPQLPFSFYAISFSTLAAIVLAGLDRFKAAAGSVSIQKLLRTTFLAYVWQVVFAGILSEDNLTIAWAMAIVAGLMMLYSYVVKSEKVEIAGAVFSILSIFTWVSITNIPTAPWRFIISIVLATSLMAIGALFHQSRKESSRRDLLVAIGAIVFAGLVLNRYYYYAITSFLLLIGGGFAMLALRIRLALSKSSIGQIAKIFYVLYPLLTMIVSLSLTQGWLALAIMIFALVLLISSYVEDEPAIMILGNIFYVIGLSLIWDLLNLDRQIMVHAVSWLSAATFYAMYWFNWDRGELSRQNISFWSTIVMLALAAVKNILFGGREFVIASALSLVAVAAVLALQGYMEKNKNQIEVSVYMANFGVQRIFEMLLPGSSLIFYSYWWALVIGLMSVWRQEAKSTRLALALAFVSFPTAMRALEGENGYQLFFLLEHVIVAVVGALITKQWMMWWGIIATVLAILYFLRNYTFMALLFAGVLLIVFVVWKLTKGDDRKSDKK